MNIIEKRDFIHNHLSKANEKVIDELFERLRAEVEKENTLKSKLNNRALQSEEDIKAEKLFSKNEVKDYTQHHSR
ncbi:MAG: hypothetical protein V5A47_03190 [Bacteroidales bacterium]|nr:hypothetical protein [Bacteroidales bacterium]MBS3776662.1 hypothetical protein [Bacteroidales bacterium]